MFSVPDGRAANQPLADTTFKPPMAALLPGAFLGLARIGSPANVVAVAVSESTHSPNTKVRPPESSPARWNFQRPN